MLTMPFDRHILETMQFECPSYAVHVLILPPHLPPSIPAQGVGVAEAR